MLALPQEARERQQRRWGWAAAPVLGAHPQEASRLPTTLPAPPPGQSGPYAPCLCGGGPKAHVHTLLVSGRPRAALGNPSLPLRRERRALRSHPWLV